jgi:predicted N-acetyltransferase YhbS
MQLVTADWREILQVLKESFEIWSPGLDRQSYYHYVWRQMSHVWSRSHFRFLVYRDGETIVASCKLYEIDLAGRGKTHRFAGIGAVFTQTAFRGQGHARRMLRGIIDRCRRQGYAGLLLFSDIGAQYYQELGFVDLGCNEFFVYMPDAENGELGFGQVPEVAALLKLEPRVTPVELSHIPILARHYNRWLRHQSFGFARSEHYWSFKLRRELFLHTHSRWSWPRMELVELAEPGPGYALIEYSAKTLRALEIIGPAETRIQLWQSLLSLALKRGARRLRAWEGLRPDFLKRPHLADRQWGCPMILPLSAEIEAWTSFHPCPILELDHL